MLTMHGIILKEFKTFTGIHLGGNAWNNVMRETGIGLKYYLPIQEYPDSEMEKLIIAIAKKMNIKIPELHEKFGERIAPALLDMYKNLIRPEWKTIDLIEHTEDTIHSVVRVQKPGSKPPALECTRIDEKNILIKYSSSRKMCRVARGIIKGLATHFREYVKIEENSCMLNNNAFCTIKVTVT